MCKLWVGKVYGSALKKGKAGVLILIHKNFPCKVVSMINDSEGHLLTLYLCIATRDLVVTNVYAPNSPSKSFFQSVSTDLAPFLHLPLVIGDDFNSVMVAQEDKSMAKPPILPSPTNPSQSTFLFCWSPTTHWSLAISAPQRQRIYLLLTPALHFIQDRLPALQFCPITYTSETLIHDISDHAPLQPIYKTLAHYHQQKCGSFSTI